MYGLGINPEVIKRRVRTCDYLVVAQLYLKNNFLLSRPLTHDDIKPRLLGHWGTCHGINLCYANLKAQYQDDPNFTFVLGPGHGFPALQANLFIDGDLAKIDEKSTRDKKGIEYICKNFSWPGGFPSHASPITPGVICEGGELGYSLATAYGAALGHPEKTVAVLIGDGEFETATALASLNLCKLLNTDTNGRVLPILHLNGYKISAPTISARKSERELKEMLRGFGYTPLVIDGEDTDEFQQALLSTVENPFIIMKTEKGATGPAYVGQQKVAGNYYAHQIPLKDPKTDDSQLHTLETWLKNYRFNELFNEELGFTISSSAQLANSNQFANQGQPVNSTQASQPAATQQSQVNHLSTNQPNSVPDLSFPTDLMGPTILDRPGTEKFSSAKKLGQLLKYTFTQDPNFYLFSPDETTSNKLDAVYDVTARAWNLPRKKWDMPESPSGRIVELLSENVLFSLLTGHILGSHAQGMMTSYESFFQIISSQLIQYLKFLGQSESATWRASVPALNLLSTSTCWRQDHNGYSHQSPALISTLLSYPAGHATCFFPVDDVSAAAVYNYMYHSQNVVNLTTFNKTDEPRWIDKNHAAFQLQYGVSIFGFASDDNPDYIFTAAGDIMTREALAAIEILRQDLPGRRFRFVGIAALSHGAIGVAANSADRATTTSTPTSATPSTLGPMPQEIFNDYFTEDKPIIANFHGYPDDLRAILVNYADPLRISTHGYIERGSTTTPFEMLSLNRASRYHLCLDVVMREQNHELIQKYQDLIHQNSTYARIHGTDLVEV